MAEKIYHISEIFPSLQGEGAHSGMAALFVRFAGCNLSCSFCDTDFSAKEHLSLDGLMEKILGYGYEHIILTGGEPALQIDEALISRLHAEGLRIHVETNGTLPLPEGIDWITCSPKSENAETIHLSHADEVKVVYTGQDIRAYEEIISKLSPSSLRLQPCDTGNSKLNAVMTRQAVEAIMTNPKWRLSLQTHKLINIK